MNRVILVCVVMTSLLLVETHGIHISTPDYETIYSGPGGVPSPGWDTVVNPFLYTSHQSVAQVSPLPPVP